MKQVLSVVAVTLATLGAAQAQESSTSHTQTPPERPWRVLGGFGISMGGDMLASGPDQTISAGEGIQFHLGGEYRIHPKVSLQASVGVETAYMTPPEGDISFRRIPLELMAYYHLDERWRIGVGARYIDRARLRGKGELASVLQMNFQPTTGAVFEAEYMATPNVGLKLRWTEEHYRPTSYGRKFDARKLGVFANYYY